MALSVQAATFPCFAPSTCQRGAAARSAAPHCLRVRPAPARPAVPPPPAPRQLPPPSALPGTDPPDLPMDDETRSELPQWLTLAGYACISLAPRAGLGSFHLTAPLIYQALTWYTLVWCGLAALDLRFNFDFVGTAVGPIFLAVQALQGFGGRVAPFETATALFGWFMLDQLPAFPYSRWAWLATLAAAIYRGMPAQWLVGAFGLSALGRLFRGGNRIRPQELAFAGLAGWAFYKQAEVPLALMIMAAQMAVAVIS